MDMKNGARPLLALVVVWASLWAPPLQAERGILVLNVEVMPAGRSVRGLQIGTRGDGSTAPVVDGKARLKLPVETVLGSWVTLRIAASPPRMDLVMVSPWDYRVPIQSWANTSDNYASVIVCERGDRAALENGSVVTALVARVNAANAPKTAKEVTSEQDRSTHLAAVAAEVGLSSADLQRAIQAWMGTAHNAYEKGLAALYAQNYPEATRHLSASLAAREQQLERVQTEVAEAARFLGQSQYEQGHYRESAASYAKAAALIPDDPVLLNVWAMSLAQAGDYSAAESLFRRVLAIDEKTLGPDHPLTAAALNNLAFILQSKGDSAPAELLYRRVLAFNEKTFGHEHPLTAIALNNLADLLRNQGNLAAAEPLYRRALGIVERALGPDHPSTATYSNNLALLLKDLGNLAAAEPLFRRALAIDEKALGPDHPSTATDLNNLANLLRDQGNIMAAEPLSRRALAIAEKVLGPDHPSTATALNNLASLLRERGNLTAAEPLYRRALTIKEKTLGSEHPSTAISLNNLGDLLQLQGNLAAADPLYRRALAIHEKARGAEHPTTMTILSNLASLLDAKGDTVEAETLWRRLVDIYERVVGPEQARTIVARTRLARNSVKQKN